MNTKSGFIAIVGRPNVGKSTLINKIIGEKISIITNKPQTTRHNILGIKTTDNVQAVYVDTPGMHEFKGKVLNKNMNKTASSALADVEAVLFVVEALVWNKEDELVLKKLTNITAPVFLIINKVDKVKIKDKLLPFIEKLKDKFNFKDIIPLVAFNGDYVEALETKVNNVLPEGPFYFEADAVTDKKLNFQLAELIREQLMLELREELPYSLAVAIECIKVEKLTTIHAVIYVARASQKPIVIGKKGSTLKKVGINARKEIEKLLKKQVNLQLWVKVKDDWINDNKVLKELGLSEDM